MFDGSNGKICTSTDSSAADSSAADSSAVIDVVSIEFIVVGSASLLLLATLAAILGWCCCCKREQRLADERDSGTDIEMVGHRDVESPSRMPMDNAATHKEHPPAEPDQKIY